MILRKKSKLIFLRFFPENYTLHCMEFVHNSKKYFDLTKIFVLRLFKMPPNQTEFFRIIIKFAVAKKCKPCEAQLW